VKFALLSRPRTQALLDGTLKSQGLPVEWLPVSAPLGWAPPTGEEYRSLSSGQFDGGEMSISSFVETKAQGAPIVALPVFLKRGLVQRSLFCPVDSALAAPAQLVGKRVGLVHYTSSMATWMRGILEQEYSLPRSGPAWFTLTPSATRTGFKPTLLEMPSGYAGAHSRAREELDGYSHELEQPEAFLLSLMKQGELDAVVSYQTRLEAKDIQTLLSTEELFESPDRGNGVYPINHIFVVRESTLKEFPGIGNSLWSILNEARKLWRNYLPQAEREPMEKELARLGWDPFAYRLGDLEKHTLETFVDFLLDEKRITRRLAVEELIDPDSTGY